MYTCQQASSQVLHLFSYYYLNVIIRDKDRVKKMGRNVPVLECSSSATCICMISIENIGLLYPITLTKHIN
jgi:hypothetical protein